MERVTADQVMDMTGAKPLAPAIPTEVVREVARRPRLFSDAVFDLASIDRTSETRTPDELACMHLYRNALCGLVAQRQQYVKDMVHNATAGVKKTERRPFFAP